MINAAPTPKIRALDGGTFGGYLAKPATGTGPGMIIIQEIFGVNAGIRAIADSYAAAGYVVLAPDLFWRQQPNIQLTDQTEAEWQQAFALYNGFDVEKGIADLLASLAFLRQLPGCTGVVGAVGYCLGGKLAYLMATRTDVDAAVSYYGVGLEGLLDDVREIRRPLLLHIAEKDAFVPAAAQSQILAAISPNPHITSHVYAGMDHAFARQGGKHYDAVQAALANSRTHNFFTATLKKAGNH